MFAPSMERVAARVRCERVHQEMASFRVAGNYFALSSFKIAVRLFVVPSGGAWRKALQPKRGPSRVANIAACVAGTLGQKNGLHASLKKLKIQRGCHPGRRRRLRDRPSHRDNQKYKSHRKLVPLLQILH